MVGKRPAEEDLLPSIEETGVSGPGPSSMNARRVRRALGKGRA